MSFDSDDYGGIGGGFAELTDLTLTLTITLTPFGGFAELTDDEEEDQDDFSKRDPNTVAYKAILDKLDGQMFMFEEPYSSSGSKPTKAIYPSLIYVYMYMYVTDMYLYIIHQIIGPFQ